MSSDNIHFLGEEHINTIFLRNALSRYVDYSIYTVSLYTRARGYSSQVRAAKYVCQKVRCVLLSMCVKKLERIKGNREMNNRS